MAKQPDDLIPSFEGKPPGYFLTIELTEKQGRAFAALLARTSPLFDDDPEAFAAHLLLNGMLMFQIDENEMERERQAGDASEWQSSEADSRDPGDDVPF